MTDNEYDKYQPHWAAEIIYQVEALPEINRLLTERGNKPITLLEFGVLLLLRETVENRLNLEEVRDSVQTAESYAAQAYNRNWRP